MITTYVIRDLDGTVYATVKGNGCEPFYDAMRLARMTAEVHPGLTIQVAEDKVWYTVRNNPEDECQAHTPTQ